MFWEIFWKSRKIDSLHPKEFILQLNAIQSILRIPWQRFKIILQDNFTSIASEWYATHKGRFKNYETFSKLFLNFFWRQHRQQQLLYQITVPTNFKGNSKPFTIQAASLKFQNLYLDHPLSEQHP